MDEANIVMTIEDNGKGIEPEKLKALNLKLASMDIGDCTNIGLENVYGRLRIVFGEPYGLSISSHHGFGTKVTICFPAKAKADIKALMK